jgi:hypothetical protein
MLGSRRLEGNRASLAGQVQRGQRLLDEGAQAAHEPMHVVLQHAAHEHQTGRAVLRGANALALDAVLAGPCPLGLIINQDQSSRESVVARRRALKTATFQGLLPARGPNRGAPPYHSGGFSPVSTAWKTGFPSGALPMIGDFSLLPASNH